MAKKAENLDEMKMPALRPDLIVSMQPFEGRTCYIIKDPIGMQYFRFSAEDYALLALFDGQRTVAEIREAWTAQFPHIRMEGNAQEVSERVARHAQEYALMQLLNLQWSGVQHNVASRKRSEKKNVLARFFQFLLFFKTPLFDPNELFGRMSKKMSWIWSVEWVVAAVLLMLTAVVLFIANVSAIAPNMDRFFQLQNLVTLWLGIIVAKSIHEFGHGLTCKHFGGEVHEIGIMVLMFTPFFYVNVTDSWMMPKRWHRIWVSAAGMYVELMVATLATFLWVIVQPGPLQDFLFNLILVTSISTLVFNANPLMRFDGYYILMDFLEIPNLIAKARLYTGTMMKRFLWGNTQADVLMARTPMPEKRFGFFVFYAVAAHLYSLIVIYSISRIFLAILKPYGLEGVGFFLSLTVFTVYGLLPVVGFFKSVGLTRQDWEPGGRWRRFSLRMGLMLVALVALGFTPIERAIRRSSVIDSAEPQYVRAQVSGFIKKVYVEEGDLVAKGQPVALLENRSVSEDYEVRRLQLEISEKLVQEAMGHEQPSAYRQALLQKAQAEAGWKEARQDYEHLQLRAQEEGIILNRNLKRLEGHYLKRGDLLTQIDPARTWVIRVPLDEKQVYYVKAGQKVDLKVKAFPDEVFHGVIRKDPLVQLKKDLPPSLSARRQGDVVTEIDEQGKEVPSRITYHAEIEMENPGGRLRSGMSGRVKIYTGEVSLGKWVGQYLLDLVSLDYRL